MKKTESLATERSPEEGLILLKLSYSFTILEEKYILSFVVNKFSFVKVLARIFSPGSMERVQGSQPILG